MDDADITSTPGFASSVVRFSDGSRWQIQEALSNRKYQQDDVPCEARQVFKCVCLEDPAHKYDGVKEAVMKVKSPVIASDDTIKRHEHLVRHYEEYAARESNCEKVASGLQEQRTILNQARNPTAMPSEASRREVDALEYLTEENCAYTPHLLDVKLGTLEEDVDDKAVVGGFVLFILMTKLPGKPLSSNFWDFSICKRHEIRSAFKKALMDLFRLRIEPKDCALRNLVWDDEGNTCYIVDFENYYVLPAGKESIFRDRYLRYLDLAESCCRRRDFDRC